MHIPKDKTTGSPRTFGFVEFTHEISVEYASALLNGIPLYGRALTVKPQRPSEGIGSESPRSGSPGVAQEIGLSPQGLINLSGNAVPDRGLYRSFSTPEMSSPQRQWQFGGNPQFYSGTSPQSRSPLHHHATMNSMQMAQLPPMGQAPSMGHRPPMQRRYSPPTHQGAPYENRNYFPR